MQDQQMRTNINPAGLNKKPNEKATYSVRIAPWPIFYKNIIYQREKDGVEAELPWILKSPEEELLEEPLFPNMPEHPKAEEAATLLLLKYCLLEGNVVAESKRSLETWTTRGELEAALGDLGWEASFTHLRTDPYQVFKFYL